MALEQLLLGLIAYVPRTQHLYRVVSSRQYFVGVSARGRRLAGVESRPRADKEIESGPSPIR